MDRGLVERAIGLALVALLIALVLAIVRPFAGPLIWAITLAVALWPPFARLRAGLGGRTGLAAALVTAALLVLLVLPLGRLAFNLGSQADDVVRLAADLSHSPLPQPPDWLVRLPLVGGRVQELWASLASDRAGTLEAALPYVRGALGWLLQLGAGLGVVVLEVLFAVLLTGLMLANGEVCALYLRRFVARIAGERAVAVIDVAGGTIRSVALCVDGTALIQALLAFLGYTIAEVPGGVILSILVFAFSLLQLPVLLAVLPAPIWLWYQDQTGWAVFLLVWGVAVGLIDNVLRPYLISQGSTLPILLIVLGVVGGLLAFGPIGLFFGAVVVAVAHRLMLDWLDQPPVPAPPTVARLPEQR
jgi:predicted PurR-regulated permease PerM